MMVAEVDRLISEYEGAPDARSALRVLDLLAASSDAPDWIADGYDDLAEAAAEEEDYATAVTAQRRALGLGCSHPEIGRDMLAWYLLKDGQRVAGEALFAEILAERDDDDAELWLTIGNARSDAGHVGDALVAFERALEAARRSGDGWQLERARAERQYWREELGLAADEEDALVGRSPRFERPTRVSWSVAWFPREEQSEAIRRWPDLADVLADPDAYCREMDGKLRELQAELGRRPALVPLQVTSLVRWAEAEGRDPGEGSTRAAYAAERARAGEARSWPPERNDTCWCGSGRKYKRCCGR